MILADKSRKQTSSEIGQYAENLALQYLQSQGLTFITRNFNCKHGEIDLILKHGDMVVFVEVRYRKKKQYGSGAETIDYRKKRKLLNTAEYFLQCNRKYAALPCRIDVVSICNHSNSASPEFEWIPNAIQH